MVSIEPGEVEVGTELALAMAEVRLEKGRADQLEAALATNRRIGIATGLVMAGSNVSEGEAFELLRRASMDGNRKLAALADDVIAERRLNRPSVAPGTHRTMTLARLPDGEPEEPVPPEAVA